MKWLRWTKGRQNTPYLYPYEVMLLVPKWLCQMLKRDFVLIRYKENVKLDKHMDNDLWWSGYDTYRTNIELTKPEKGGVVQFWGYKDSPGAFVKRFKVFGKDAMTFRPDIMVHSMTTVVKGERLVFSTGKFVKSRRLPVRHCSVANLESKRDIETVVYQVASFVNDYVKTRGRFKAMAYPCTGEWASINKDVDPIGIVAAMLYTIDPEGCEFSHDTALETVKSCLPEEFLCNYGNG